MLIFLLVGSGNTLTIENPHGELKIDCEICHTTASWKDVEFSHEEAGFDLSHSHARVSCVQCHEINNFAGVGKDCRGCHKDVHESRLGPDCERCHTSRQWVIFDTEEIHARTRFPLWGRHIQIDCRNCHADLLEGDYAVSARDCIDCHEGDYLTTGNPEHVSLGISTSCSECHEPIQWRPANFPSHDPIFPIFSGEHRGAWDFCSDCHPDPAIFSIFSCFQCHSRSAMDDEHGGIQGYRYDNQTCLSCHPTGEGGEFGDHDQLYFPIFSGKHRDNWDDCTSCHIDPNNWSRFSCIDCHEHRQSKMDDTHNDIDGYVYDSQACYDCHPSGEELMIWKKPRMLR